MMLMMESHPQTAVPQFVPDDNINGGGAYMLVSGSEGDEPVEMPVESDGSVLLTNVQSQFPSAIGLKFRNPLTKAFRAIKLIEGYLFPPNAQNGWDQETVYVVNTAANANGEIKRKLNVVEDNGELEEIKKKKVSKAPQCSDLIVLGLPYHTTETELKQFFAEHGEVAFVEVKRAEGKSRGFGFIRFATFEDQKKVQNRTFMIDSRKIEVKKPTSQGGGVSCRVFVGRLSEKISKMDLLNYFEQYGAVHNVHYDHGRKMFAFVEFEDPEVAEVVLREKTHLINNNPVLVNPADPIDKNKNKQNLAQSAQQYQTGGFIPNGTQQTPQSLLSYQTTGWLQDGTEYDARASLSSMNGAGATSAAVANAVTTGLPASRLQNMSGQRSSVAAGSMDTESSVFGHDMMSAMAKIMAGAVAQHFAAANGTTAQPTQQMATGYESVPMAADQMSFYGRTAQTGLITAGDRLDSKYARR